MADDFDFKFTNYTENVAKLNKKAQQVDEAIERTAQNFVITAVREIRMRASGRPGPNVISGDLRRGYQGDIVERSFLYAKVHIWNPVKYAPYVEFMKGGQYSHYRPGKAVTIKLMEVYYKDQLDIALK